MKKIILITISLLSGQIFAITIGDKYNDQNLKLESTVNTFKIYNKVSSDSKYQIVVNKDNIITQINYEGKTQLNMPETLGKYYESYHQSWLERPNKYNHSSSKVETKDIIVKTYGLGNKVFINQIDLK